MEDLRQQSYNAIDLVYSQTLAAIKRIQGDKPYIETQGGMRDGYDRMYFIAYEDTNYQNVVEGVILGVRAVGDEIQILGSTTNDAFRIGVPYFDEEDFQFATENYATENYENDGCLDDWEWCWQTIKGSILIHLIPTLFSIAEVIEEYNTEE
jgi:hypothetical protein